MDNPGEYDKRDPPLDETKRNWDERAFTVGIGGPVGRLFLIHVSPLTWRSEP